VAAVNFLQLLLVSRLTFTSTGTCWCSLTTLRRIGGVITNHCIRRQLLSPAAFSAYSVQATSVQWERLRDLGMKFLRN